MNLPQIIITQDNLEDVNKFSMDQLKILYKDHFLNSENCRKLILELHSNFIEFRFLQNAGFINKTD